VGAPDELPLLVGLLDGLLDKEDADLRSSAAVAILRIDRRSAHGMSPWDWSIVGVYALGMLSVGLYYSRRSKTTEDYLLGGRKMNPLWVGLSLFATMLSALTYLATPGELIKNGPILLLGQIIAFPLIALVVGWFLIPFIMKMKITSAYEMLETRLGLGVRMLGSTFFLSLRLMWMATIIFATSDKVLVPLLGLDHSATPWLCALLALVTVAYTTMGGLRAVVFTDVVQTMILFGGAFLTLALISNHFGGVGGWWPTEWSANWPALRWGYDPNPEVRTIASVLMATFVWFVCTSGSDQMAIQRYLSTKDVKAARTTLIFSLVAAALAITLLSVVGLALLAFFNSNPHLIADGERVLGDADKLFPRYIAVGLPAGCSGLVMAGLLAASMSSLSSGVNSSCSVIIVDFIDRFRKRKDSELDHVKMAKWISVLVGIVIVLLSTVIGMIQGNLLDLCFKVCNLLTAPLFGLFFMAMFVRWATGAGTLVGALFGVVVVVVISFWKDLFASPTEIQGISILWAMPLSLLVQISVGTVASLVIGRRREAEIA
jgi:SSS family solute:Na+ symporter